MTDARRLVELFEGLAQQRLTVMDLVRGAQPVEAWRLYPGEEGIFDRRTRCQFYYHAHDDGRDEDGHFHTVRLFANHTVHVAGISMARSGWPQAVFTVNLWAIGDAYESAAALKKHVRRFRLDEEHGPADVIRFVNLMFRVFRPEIESLQDEKMSTLVAHRLAHPDRDPFEDRSLEIVSRVEIDVLARAASQASTA